MLHDFTELGLIADLWPARDGRKLVALMRPTLVSVVGTTIHFDYQFTESGDLVEEGQDYTLLRYTYDCLLGVEGLFLYRCAWGWYGKTRTDLGDRWDRWWSYLRGALNVDDRLTAVPMRTFDGGAILSLMAEHGAFTFESNKCDRAEL